MQMLFLSLLAIAASASATPCVVDHHCYQICGVNTSNPDAINLPYNDFCDNFMPADEQLWNPVPNALHTIQVRRLAFPSPYGKCPSIPKFKLTSESFKGLEALTFLNLKCAQLKVKTNERGQTELDRQMFEGLDKLISFSIQNNNISVIHADTFKAQRDMQFLYMPGNNIREVEDGSFDHMTKLSELDLSGNKLQRVPAIDLKKLNQVRYVNMIDNNITILRPQDVEGFGAVHFTLGETQLHELDRHTFHDWHFEELRSYGIAIYSIEGKDVIDAGVPGPLNIAHPQIILRRNGFTAAWYENHSYASLYL